MEKILEGFYGSKTNPQKLSPKKLKMVKTVIDCYEKKMKYSEIKKTLEGIPGVWGVLINSFHLHEMIEDCKHYDRVENIAFKLMNRKIINAVKHKISNGKTKISINAEYHKVFANSANIIRLLKKEHDTCNRLIKDAKKYTTRTEWEHNSNDAYQLARTNSKLFKICCKHMQGFRFTIDDQIHELESIHTVDGEPKYNYSLLKTK